MIDTIAKLLLASAVFTGVVTGIWLVVYAVQATARRVTMGIWRAPEVEPKVMDTVELPVVPADSKVEILVGGDEKDADVANCLIVWGPNETVEQGRIYARLVPDWIPACDACANWPHRKECGAVHPEWENVDFRYVTLLCTPCMRFAFDHFGETGHLHLFGPIA